jgi:predicted AlkP superfamily pyrophosphatase or phosphodiesterase
MQRLAFVLAFFVVGCGSAMKVGTLVAAGDSLTERTRPPGTAPSSPASPQVMLLAFDGVSRDLLYDLLRAGKLPNLTALLGGDGLAHAHLNEHLLSNLPSTTMPAWTSTLTGVGAAEHGVPNNEFFVRETKRFEAPAPVSFADATPTLDLYTDGYMSKLVTTPGVYERIHAEDPNALVWVVMHPYFRDADTLLLAKRIIIAKAFEGFLEQELSHGSGKSARRVYEELDKAAIESLVSHLERGPVPDMLTLYLSGTDLYAHVAEEGPDEARQAYLTEVIDPAMAPLVARMRARGMLDDRWIIVTADHGHTQVVHDEAHAISTGDEDAPGVLKKLGYKVRPHTWKVDAADPFNAVVAYGGAMGFVYLADRSKCPGEKEPCAWADPPRYHDDVLLVAEGYYQNNEDGSLAPGMKGALDMIFVREPRPVAEVDLPFDVYVGDGKTLPIDDYLKLHPHPTYVDLAKRMHELAVGSHGERAGDILLLAHNGDRDRPEDRFYFAAPYRSWHGSPSKLDSEIPLIVANPRHEAAAIGSWVRQVLGDRPYQRKVSDIILGLRKRGIH